MGKTQFTAPDGLPFVGSFRDFDAPPELVFRAWTEPELLVQWLGPRRYRMRIDRWEVRDGGAWRYVHTADNGDEYGFHGVFHGAPSLDGMVQTFEFEGAPGHISLDSLWFEDLGGGRTRVRTHSVFQSLEARDAMYQSGMAGGVDEGYERLEELLARLLAPVH